MTHLAGSRLRLPLVGVALLALTQSLIAQAAAPATPLALVDTSGKLAFTIAQVNDGVARFGVVNTTDKPLDVDLKFDSLVTLPGAPHKPNPLAALTVTPPQVRFQPRTAQTFTVDHMAAPLPGTYTALVRFVAQVGGKETDVLPAQNLVLTVPGPDLLAAKDTITLFRLWPIGPIWWPAIVALPARWSDFSFGPANRPVGAVTRDLGGWTIVRWASNGKDLTVDNPPHAGAYTGSLTLAKDPAAVTYALTVNAKDIILWPIALIAIGVYLAYAAKRYLGVIRVTLGLRVQEANLGLAFDKNQKAFADTAGSEDFAAYSIKDEVAKQRKSVIDSLNTAESTLATTLDAINSSYQDAVTGLQNLKTAIDAWPGFAKNLAKLSSARDAAIAAIDLTIIEPQPPTKTKPDFDGKASTLLKPANATLDFTQLTAKNQQADALAQLAAAWPDSFQQAAALTKHFNALPKPPAASEKPAYDAVLGSLVSIWTKLFEAVDVAALTALAADMQQCEIALGTIQSTLHQAVRTLFAPRAASTLGVRFFPKLRLDDVTLPDDAAVPPPTDQQRADQLQATIANSDAAVSLFAFAIALLTGLNTYYIGKPWGSLADYVTLFIWAAGTKATLDLVLGTIDQLTNVLTPAKPKAAA